jgi:ABC-2 type transport system ATP-binding protein
MPDPVSGAVEVRSLRKSYEGKEVLHSISFSIPPGQVCGYLGPNGAGKSTTIRALAGILRPDAGTILIAGHDIADDPIEAKRAIGYVPETGALYGLLSAREHLHLIADLYSVPEDIAADRIRLALSDWTLTAVADRRLDTLSKGQRQKTAIAAALLHDPHVLLFDEPLNGLDVTAARKLKDTLRALAQSGRAILYCSHVLDVVERVCDRAIILDQGTIVADAPTTELVKRSRDATLESVFHALVRSDAAEGIAADG